MGSNPSLSAINVQTLERLVKEGLLTPTSLYRDERFQLFQFFLPDALDLFQLFNRCKRPMVVAVNDNAFGIRFPDSGKLHQLLFGGSVNIDDLLRFQPFAWWMRGADSSS